MKNFEVKAFSSFLSADEISLWWLVKVDNKARLTNVRYDFQSALFYSLERLQFIYDKDRKRPASVKFECKSFEYKKKFENSMFEYVINVSNLDRKSL